MDLRANEMKAAVYEMSNFLRSEDIGNNYLNLFAGENVLNSVFNIKNQIIYGRRGTGKTHLLKALEELCYQTLYEKKCILFILI